MSKRIMLISEALSAPFDEGFKNITFSLYRQLESRTSLLSVTNIENNTENLKITKIRLNKLFFNYKLRLIIKNFSPDIIIYIPLSSCSFYSFVRAKVLKLFSKTARVVMLGSQHREHTFIQGIMLAFLKPDLLLLLGKSDKDFYAGKGLSVKVLPPAVDCTRFSPAGEEEKKSIRKKMNIPRNVKVVLHVGHINTNRNLELLIDIQKIENIQVVIVGSTSTEVELDLKEKLIKYGIIVIDKFISEISNVYKMSDIYVFPVFNQSASIDMPLSVLEAMACNLPVITSRFDALLEYFNEDEGFKYFASADDLLTESRIIKSIDGCSVTNRKKVEFYTWERFSDEVIGACKEIE